MGPREVDFSRTRRVVAVPAVPAVVEGTVSPPSVALDGAEDGTTVGATVGTTVGATVGATVTSGLAVALGLTDAVELTLGEGFTGVATGVGTGVATGVGTGVGVGATAPHGMENRTE